MSSARLFSTLRSRILLVVVLLVGLAMVAVLLRACNGQHQQHEASLHVQQLAGAVQLRSGSPKQQAERQPPTPVVPQHDEAAKVKGARRRHKAHERDPELRAHLLVISYLSIS